MTSRLLESDVLVGTREGVCRGVLMGLSRRDYGTKSIFLGTMAPLGQYL